MSSPSTVAFYTAPAGGESSGSLIDEATSSSVAPTPAIAYEMIGGSSPNAFWIVCQCGSFLKQMDLPYGMYARVLAQPAVNGPLTMYEQYPSGAVRTYNLGWVYAQHNYRLWFRADAPGTHLVKYSVGGGDPSQTLTFNVY